MPLTVRRFEPTDASSVEQLISRLEGAYTAEGRECLLADASKHDALVAEHDGCIVGVAVSVSTGLELELLWIAVSMDARRMGIASMLVHEMEQNDQHSVVVLTKTADPNRQSNDGVLSSDNYRGVIQFLHSVGFESAGGIDNYWGPGYHALLLAKRRGWQRE